MSIQQRLEDYAEGKIHDMPSVAFNALRDAMLTFCSNAGGLSDVLFDPHAVLVFCWLHNPDGDWLEWDDSCVLCSVTITDQIHQQPYLPLAEEPASRCSWSAVPVWILGGEFNEQGVITNPKTMALGFLNPIVQTLHVDEYRDGCYFRRELAILDLDEYKKHRDNANEYFRARIAEMNSQFAPGDIPVFAPKFEGEIVPPVIPPSQSHAS